MEGFPGLLFDKKFLLSLIGVVSDAPLGPSLKSDFPPKELGSATAACPSSRH